MKPLPALALAVMAVMAALPPLHAATLQVTAPDGAPLAGVMVTQRIDAPAADRSDGGYPRPGVTHHAAPEITRFSGADGRVTLDDRGQPARLRLRKPGWRDLVLEPGASIVERVVLQPETDAAALAAQRPANAWWAALDIGGAEVRDAFALQCMFCHQQGSAPMRRERSAEQWHTDVSRMVGYGSRLSGELQATLPPRLEAAWRELRAHPGRVSAGTPWDTAVLAGATIREWPLGDGMSQMHDMIEGRDGRVYVADNIQDRLYVLDPANGDYTVHKIPHRDDDRPGGLLAARLRDFPRHDSTSNAHSLAQSARDGHIFITPSAQRRLVEFDPASGRFTLHEIGGGFYPHTVRIDARDRVWFTLALSNQIGMLDRASGRFTLYDLPARGLMERLTTRWIGVLFKLMEWGLPISRWMNVDARASGTPLPYGIDVTPDGNVWFARLHTDEIGRLEPDSGRITMFATPFKGPRRLRTDGEGNVWVTVFPQSRLARFEPASGRFTTYELPVVPRGSETPYGLNVDRRRGVVWVNGNQSDMLFALHVASGTWRAYPLPRRVSFTRDVEVTASGAVYTSNANFPSWHIEDGQPTLMRIDPQ